MTDTSQLVDPKQERIYTFHFRHSNKHVDLTDEELDHFPYLIALVEHKNDFLSVENENGEYVLSHSIEYPWFISILRSIKSEQPYTLFNDLSEDNNVLDTLQLFDYLCINPFPLPLLKYEELVRSNPTNIGNDEKRLDYHQANLSEARQTAAEFIIALKMMIVDLNKTKETIKIACKQYMFPVVLISFQCAFIVLYAVYAEYGLEQITIKNSISL
ncbi:unnamed protein product [Rotaria sordida]|uniref:Uncharacterized protein n=1 Tax=Rotaria sordida TaxID=392033 RepID=A0A814WZN0_9BILA|nr:unnamed protein product [Rotaria sordida]CAF1208739.1 unnamed protein product [Rotaria sordida]